MAVRVFFAITIVTVLVLAFISNVSKQLSAWYCAGNCQLTCIEWRNGKCVKYRAGGSCNVNLQGGEFSCSSGGEKAACGCFGGDCDEAGGLTCTNAGSVCECSCEEQGCPAGVPPNKFMTKPTVQGYGRSCNSGGCDGESYACPPVHLNNAPTCSILPSEIVLDREDSPKQFTLKVTDKDYGDSVEVTGVKVVDIAGNLNSCINVTGLDGQSLLTSVVRSGSDNPSRLTQDTPFLVDPRESHGIFARDPATGKSLCKGILKVEIRDADSDGPSGPDKSDTVSCQVGVSVTNNAPQLTSVRLEDRDENSALRTQGNLINGTRATVFVGSTANTSTKSTAAFCKEALSLTNPIKCKSGDEQAVATRRNPLYLEFTVSDNNGADDIMQAGVWLELNRTGVNPNTPTLPLTNANAGGVTRYSFQALYSEKESRDIAGVPYFISRGCLTAACGPLNLATSSKQVFTGLGLIAATNQMGAYAGDGAKVGNLLRGNQQIASTNEWHQKGFPDCILQGNCNGSNVPTIAKSVATADNTKDSNYAWAIGSDESTMLCYPTSQIVPKVVQVSTPVVCPANCAACIKKEGATAGSNGKDITFRFGIYFNDNEATPSGGESAQGMPAGKYSIFVSALDKVGVRLGGVERGGDDGWVRFDKAGNVCDGACDANFTITYDPLAPKVTFNKWTYTADQLDTITATGSATDEGGSRITGLSNRYIARGETLDGEPLGEYKWAMREDGVTPFDGANDIDYDYAGGPITLQGKGLIADESITAGACVFDGAGNMGCGKNDDGYVFLSAWLKTTLGDIFSSKSNNPPFGYTIPTNTNLNGIINNDNTRNSGIYSPYTEQIFTGGTGVVMTSSTGALGLSGGYVPSATARSSLPLGFKSGATSYYRDGMVTQRYNLFGVNALTMGSEYERSRAAATLNCELMNETTPGVCQTNGSLATVGNAEYNILNTGTTTIDSLTCSKVNIIFVSGILTVRGDVLKSDQSSGCLFVLANGAALNIEDIPSNSRPADTDGKGKPHVDRFQAAIVANGGASISVKKALNQAANKSVDRLEITGWVYSADTPPNFLRNLAAVDNRRYPAEWIIYDATLLDLFRPLLGAEKTVDLTCGTSGHILCTTVSKNL